MFFHADWLPVDQNVTADESVQTFLSNYSANCVLYGCLIDSNDGLCQCPIAVESLQLFTADSEVVSIETILSKASIGAFQPTGTGEDVAGIPGVQKYPAGTLTADTIFEFYDGNGRKHYRKNVLSKTVVGNGKLEIRTPVSFFTLSEFTKRDSEYEVDAALEQYFYHPNTAPFIAVSGNTIDVVKRNQCFMFISNLFFPYLPQIRLAQRFGISNPSPTYVEAIATAFQKGSYQSFGSNKYGCLKATIAAVVFHREAQDTTLDADPAQ
jgi:hypothetical protein